MSESEKTLFSHERTFCFSFSTLSFLMHKLSNSLNVFNLFFGKENKLHVSIINVQENIFKILIKMFSRNTLFLRKPIYNVFITIQFYCANNLILVYRIYPSVPVKGFLERKKYICAFLMSKRNVFLKKIK